MTWTPVPDKVTKPGEFEALLATVTLPATPPVAAGVKVTLKVPIWPGVSMSPADTPVEMKPGPEIVTFEIVIFELPEFVNVMARALLLPMFTLPKLSADVLAVSAPGGIALTVRVATLLVTLPTELVTTTENCAALSAVVSAGVV